MNKLPEPKKSNYYFKILITECILVGVVLLGAFTIKLCFKAEYKKLKQLFKEQYYSTTDIDEVLYEI